MHINELIEGLPKTSEKNKADAVDLDKLSIHARLIAALNGAPRPSGLQPLSEVVKLDETKRAARLWDTIVVPEGTHEKLAEAFTGPIGPEKTLPDDIHARASKALCR